MSEKRNDLNKINDSHPGWINNSYTGGKTHYYITEQGCFSISVCGQVPPSKDLDNYYDENYKYSNTIDKYCKRCLLKYMKMQEGKNIEIKLNSIIS